MTTVFFFARLWRRSGLITDAEFSEMRYSGRAAVVDWEATEASRLAMQASFNNRSIR